MRNAALMTVAAVLLCSTPAFAGGRSNNGTLRIVNSTVPATQLFVLVNPTAKQLANIQAAPGNATVFRNNGGRVLAGGAILDLRAVPGTNARVLATANANGTFPSDTPVPVLPAGQVSLIRLSGAPGPGVAPTVTFVMNSLPRNILFASFGLGGVALLVLAGYALNRKRS